VIDQKPEIGGARIMWIPFRLMPRKGEYMDADTPLPEKCVQERRVSTYVFHSFLSEIHISYLCP